MTTPLRRTVGEVIARALVRARSCGDDGQSLWLHTWVIEPLQTALSRDAALLPKRRHTREN